MHTGLSADASLGTASTNFFLFEREIDVGKFLINPFMGKTRPLSFFLQT
jgi:hypothetical protein